jgi:glutamate/tyrosine decarboxylase-like PLP-dependent enzyme
MIYHPGEEHHEFLKRAHNLFFSENALNPMAFKSLKRMETEVIDMTASLLHGDEHTAGTMTSGGTESILLAVKCYRDLARKKKPWILRPEIVAPQSIHVAFDKAAHAFGLRLKKVPLGPDYRVDVRRLHKAISRNTIMIAASAPQYAHGVLDPIEEIASIAEARSIPFHVDACFGGFILPWLEKLGYPIAPFDFRIPGVTSISSDIHKYGYAPKGCSTILYRNMDYLKHQFFAVTDWPGGIYVSPTLPGSRPGSAIASAWASLMALGETGFMQLAHDAIKTTEELRYGIEAIAEFEIVGSPECTIVSYTTSPGIEDFSIYGIADFMETQGWGVDRQQLPPCIHCSVNAFNANQVRPYLDDLRRAVAYCRSNPGTDDAGNAAMYGMMAKLPSRRFVKYSVLRVMELMYAPGKVDFDFEELTADEGSVLSLLNTYGRKAINALTEFSALEKLFRNKR